MYKFDKKIKILIIIIVSIIITIIGYYLYNLNESENFFKYDEINNAVDDAGNTEKEQDKIDTEKNENVIIVHIAGYVINPGVIQLPENSRVSDAVEKAGGLTEEADISRINLAYVLEDGVKVYIPSFNETKDEEKSQEYLTKEGGGVVINDEVNLENNRHNNKKNSKVNINTAAQNELESLPGIGSVTANKIISYRNENGKFKYIEDIKNVKGIGENKFAQIKDLICVK